MGQTINLVSQFGAPTFTSLRVIGNTTLGNNLVVSGSITAQSLIVNSTSVYSGSTRFGEIITNTHQFTGSIFNSGSITTIGSVTAASFVGSGASLTSIPNSSLSNSTISGIALGSNLATLTIGTGLSGTSYNGSGAVTIANTGVTSIVAGTNISISSGTGAVTITNGITNNNQLTNGAGYITSYTETDTLGSVTNRGSSTSQNITFSNGRKGLVGVYDAAQTQAIFAMGAAYVLTDGGASNVYGPLYGLAWSYNPDYGGVGNNPQSKAGLNHQLLLMQNGVTTAAMGSGIWTSGNISAANFSGTSSGTNTGDQTNISGNAVTAGGLAVHAGRNNEADKIVRTQANGYILCGYINSSNGNENNNSNPDRVWGTNGSDDYLRTYRTSALSVSYAATAGSAPANGGTAAAVNQTVAADTNANLVYSQMGSNDFFRIRVGGASNAGYAEIATADDGTEPIYVRQYTGVFSDVTRTATLLDGSGNTSFPGNISGGYILGSYFNSSAGNSENPSIGQIWTQNTTDNYLRKSTPAHLISQLGLITTGNYSSYALPLGGGTISGNVTINGSSNTVLTLSASEPHIRIAATGGSNVAGVVIVPTSGYDAFVGNFNNGATNIMANSVKIGQFRKDTYFTPNDGNNDLRMGDGTSSTQGSISLYGSNGGAGYEGRLNCLNSDGNTHFYHRNDSAIFTDVGYFNSSGFYINVLGGPSDIRLKDIIETNPSMSIDNIDVIKYTFKSHPSLIRYGYSAQQVQNVLPDLITINSPINGSADEGTLMLNYNDLHVLKIAALERKVADLQSQINDLKSK
jgi:hypothetical protein